MPVPAFNMDDGRHRNAATVAEAQAAGDLYPVTGVKVYQAPQNPPQAEDYDTTSPDGLAVRSKRGSRML